MITDPPEAAAALSRCARAMTRLGAHDAAVIVDAMAIAVARSDERVLVSLRHALFKTLLQRAMPTDADIIPMRRP